MTTEYCRTTDAAKTLGVDVQTVRRLVRDGRLKGERWGGQYLIRTADLEAFAKTYEGRPGRKDWGNP